MVGFPFSATGAEAVSALHAPTALRPLAGPGAHGLSGGRCIPSAAGEA